MPASLSAFGGVHRSQGRFKTWFWRGGWQDTKGLTQGVHAEELGRCRVSGEGRAEGTRGEVEKYELRKPAPHAYRLNTHKQAIRIASCAYMKGGGYWGSTAWHEIA